MTNSLAGPPPAPRQIVCARCGTEFRCDLSTTCWCAAESARLPLPAGSTGHDDCLCKDCLRAVATGETAAR